MQKTKSDFQLNRERAKEKKNKRVIIAYIIGVIATILLVSTCSWKVL